MNINIYIFFETARNTFQISFGGRGEKTKLSCTLNIPLQRLNSAVFLFGSGRRSVWELVSQYQVQYFFLPITSRSRVCSKKKKKTWLSSLWWIDSCVFHNWGWHKVTMLWWSKRNFQTLLKASFYLSFISFITDRWATHRLRSASSFFFFFSCWAWCGLLGIHDTHGCRPLAKKRKKERRKGSNFFTNDIWK